MGFEILPFEPEDEDLWETFTIISPKKWTPYKFLSTNKLSYYDPTDEAIGNTVTYLAALNHMSVDKSISGEADRHNDRTNDYDPANDPFNMVSVSQPILDTQILATATWHRVIYKDIDPSLLRPYLGYRPLDVFKKTLTKTTQMARMIIKHPMRHHVKARFPHMNVTRIDEAVSTDPMFSSCRSIYHEYTAARCSLELSHIPSMYMALSPKGSSQKYTETI